MTKSINIFLASSGELKTERDAINTFIAEENKRLFNSGIFLNLIMWEEQQKSVDKDRIQLRFNELLLDSEIVIVLFYTKAGQFTLEEFNLAYDNLRKENKPDYLFVFFDNRSVPQELITKDIFIIKGIKKKLQDDEQLYIEFDTVDNLKYELKKQMDLVLPSIKSKILKKKHSQKQYNVTCKDIYPKGSIIDEILPGIGIKIDIEKRIQEQVSKKVNSENHLEKNTKKINLLAAIKELWSTPDQWHCVLIGEGGMGKTTSLLKLWGDLLSNPNIISIPIFLDLVTFNRKRRSRTDNIIFDRINEKYLESFDIKNQFKKRIFFNGREYPSIILILDGYNEVNNDTELISCLEEIRLDYQGVQIIISSRYNITEQLLWDNYSEVFTLEKLTNVQIEHFINDQEVSLYKDLSDIDILRNPMMLTLYCGIEREMKSTTDSEKYNFIASPCEKAEILHNFLISSQIRLDRYSNSDKPLHYLYLRHLLPKIAYEMEKNGDFEIDSSDLVVIIQNELKLYNTEEFQIKHTDIVIDLIRYDLKKMIDPNFENVIRIIAKLYKQYYFLKEIIEYNKKWYTFIHQNFRDYFAAEYIKEQISSNFKKFDDISNRVFRPGLRVMLGALTEERLRKPFVKDGKYIKGDKTQTVLDSALDDMRDYEFKDGDYRLINIFETLKDTRKDLSDTDLSRLDLRHVVLNNVKLVYSYNDVYHSANLSGTRINASSFIPKWHRGYVNCIDFSPDGKKIITAGQDSTIKEWNIYTGECLNTFELEFVLFQSIKYSKDGTIILSGGDDGLITEWDIEENGYLSQYLGHSGAVNSVCYSYDGQYILSGSEDETIREWDVKTEECLKTYIDHFEAVTCVCYSPDTTKIASSSMDGTIKEWDRKTGECIKTYEGHTAPVTCVTYSLDGKKIISGSEDETIIEWNIENQEILKIYKGHTDYISSLCYSPDGNTILSSSSWGPNKFWDTTIKEWNVIDGSCIKTYNGHKHGVNFAIYSPDGKRIISSSYDFTVRLWNRLSGECINIFNAYSGRINSVCVSADGRYFFSGSLDSGEAKKWDINTKKCLITYGTGRTEKLSVSCSKNEKKIFTIGSSGKVDIWDYTTGEHLKLIQVENETVLTHSPNGQLIFSASSNGDVFGRDYETKKIKYCFNELKGKISDICCSSDNSKIIASCGNIIKEWSLETSRCIHTYELERYVLTEENIKEINKKNILPQKEVSITSMLFSLEKIVNQLYLRNQFRKILMNMGFSDVQIKKVSGMVYKKTFDIDSIIYNHKNNQILAVSDKKNIDVWDADTHEHINSIKIDNPIFCVKYSLDGQYVIISTGCMIEKWDILQFKKLQTYKGHLKDVKSVCFTPDGKKIISGGLDETIKLWDTYTGECLMEIKNYFGLQVQGLNLKNLHLDSKITDEEKKILGQHGAEI